MDLFRGRIQVMIATEAGGEGINLQFCHHMINFDLPWNPMRVEQRIGRVHRLGQTHDVNIFNLSTTGTIEEHILHLLHEKINMFEMVIGGLDVILERLEKKESIEKSLYRIMLESSSDDEIRQKMQKLGHSLDSIKQEMKQLRTDSPSTSNMTIDMSSETDQINGRLTGTSQSTADLLGLSGSAVPPAKARRDAKGGR